MTNTTRYEHAARTHRTQLDIQYGNIKSKQRNINIKTKNQPHNRFFTGKNINP